MKTFSILKHGIGQSGIRLSESGISQHLCAHLSLLHLRAQTSKSFTMLIKHLGTQNIGFVSEVQIKQIKILCTCVSVQRNEV